MIPKAGARNRLVTFQRATTADNEMGEPVPTWAELGQAFAEVLFSTGRDRRDQERRDANQEGGSLAATFRVLHNPMTAGISIKDRVLFDDAIWDVVSNVPSIGLNQHREITARRAAT